MYTHIRFLDGKVVHAETDDNAHAADNKNWLMANPTGVVYVKGLLVSNKCEWWMADNTLAKGGGYIWESIELSKLPKIVQMMDLVGGI